MSIALWFTGFVGLIVAAVIASARARSLPGDVVTRGAAFAAAMTCAVLATGAIWIWGGTMATTGRADRLREGAPVRIAIHEVAVPIDHSITIGRGDVTVQLPGDGLGELARVDVEGSSVAVKPTAPSVVLVPVETDAMLGAIAAAQCRAYESADRRAYTLPPGSAVMMIACDHGKPTAAVAMRRDRARARMLLAPLQWHGRFTAPQLTVRAGDVLRVGSGEDALPGVTGWDVLAVRGAATIVAVPADPTDCAAWAAGTQAGATSRSITGGCELAAGGFTVTAIPVIPDGDGVVDRGARAAIAIATPIVMLLFALALAPASVRRSRVVARALRAGVLGVGLTALVCWRLAWAHRIDMVRDLVPAGWRVSDNLFAAIAIGATLAGLAAGVLDAVRAAPTARRLAIGIGAWALGLVAGTIVIGMPAITSVRIVVLALSLAATLIPSLRGVAIKVEHQLAAIAIAGIAARTLAPHLVLAKLGLAYALVLAGHAALCGIVASATPMRRRILLAALVVVAGLALARYDAGVTLAIAGVGLALAMLVAGHDAVYHASEAGRLGVLEREHARLLSVHGIATVIIAIAAAGFALVGDDKDLIAGSTDAALYAPLVAGALFALAAIVARSHRRAWAPWLAAALAAVAVWTARDAMINWATGGDGVAAQRVAAVVDPGYAALRDERHFANTVSAWREATLPVSGDADRWTGQGYFAARITDPGVLHSIENDYFPVLVGRECGVGGLLQGTLLLLGLVVAAVATANARLRHAGSEHRARWLVASVAGALCVYQPLASLGVLPLTGISWPGFGIDSPSDLWLLVIGLTWCLLGADRDAPDTTRVDERVRTAPRLRRARRIVIASIAAAGVASVIVVARVSASALGRAGTTTASQRIHDDRIDTALRYAESLACPWPEKRGTLDDVVPTEIAGKPEDDATARFHRELSAHWLAQRSALAEALREPSTCHGKLGKATLAKDAAACVATFDAGWPEIRLAVTHEQTGYRATCNVALPGDGLAFLRERPAAPRSARIRVVAEAMGVAARDAGELVSGGTVVRLRAGAGDVDLASQTKVAAERVTLVAGTALVVDKSRGVVLHGPADLLVADIDAKTGARGWRRAEHAGEVALDRMTLITAGARIALFRPPRAWGGATVVDPLLADDVERAGDRTRRAYPYGAAVPELGWVNPYDVDHSVGLDGWIHAAQRAPANTAMACGTLEPPAVPRDRVCTTSPLDGVLECRVTVQPELAIALHGLADRIADDPQPLTGKATDPVRIAYVVLRGDTGALLAQGDFVPGRVPLAYAPKDAAAETALIRLREDRDPVTGGPGTRGESDAERVDWNLPIAVGSTFKPILSRAAEEAFPQQIPQLSLKAEGSATGCKARHGTAVSPLMGHCPPAPLAGTPTTADLHDFLARSPNWYQAALGLIGLGLPSAHFEVKGAPKTLAEITASDLLSWPVDNALTIRDDTGPILGEHNVQIDGVRRTPMWNRLEALLGRPLCTLGDRGTCARAAERADVCSARSLPIKSPSRDLRHLVSLGPDRFDFYGDDRPGQQAVAVREYFQLLRGSGVHSIGSLAQLTDAFGRVVYDPRTGKLALAASWFPSPSVGTTPKWSCATTGGHATNVLGADGGLCAVVQEGTAKTPFAEVLKDPNITIYGAKTGTIDSLAEIARHTSSCETWNAHHTVPGQPLDRAHQPSWLDCGKAPPDDALFVVAFGVTTKTGVVPVTLGIQLQRGGKSSAARAAPHFVTAIAKYLRGE
jgi:hypothetical protein